MDASLLSQWLGGPYQVVLKEPAGEQVVGILRNLIPEQHLTLEKATIIRTGQQFEQLNINASNVSDIIRLQTMGPGHMPPTKHPAKNATKLSAKPLDSSAATPTQGQASFQDPAIISMTRKPAVKSDSSHMVSGETTPTTFVTNPADRVTYSFLNDTDTTESTTPGIPLTSQLVIQTPFRPTGNVTIDTTEDDLQDLTPTAATARVTLNPKERKRGKRGKKQQIVRNTDEEPTSSARPTDQSTGWRQTPILQSTKSFQPFTSLKRTQKKHPELGVDSGWASEDVTDVQEAGDFDFEGSLAKFDKRTIFNEMQEQDRIDEADRLVSHNRLPRPKPGTAGGKNLHYTENVLDQPPSTSKTTKEPPGDFWRSEAEEDLLNGGRETPNGRDGSGRSSRLREESRLSTTRRSRSRKASASVVIAGPSRASTGPSPVASTLPGLYTLASNRRIDVVTHLQMLVVENVASNELGMTEDLVAENAGRGICEVAMRSLSDPAIRLRAAASSPPIMNNVVIMAGNNKSGARAIAAARHLRNRNTNTLVCVVGVERERELLDDIRKQIRLFRNFGGSIYTKSELFEHLAQSANSLHTSPQASVSLIIDALLGLTISFEELRKSDQATTYELMEWANRNGAFVMAVDIPSGIEPSSGKINVIDGTKLYIQPRFVVALGAPKSGLLKAIENMTRDGDIVTADDWKIYLVDVGLGTTVWRKAAKIRRGPDFENSWVLELKYQTYKE